MATVNGNVLRPRNLLRKQISRVLTTTHTRARSQMTAMPGDGCVSQLDYNDHFTMRVCVCVSKYSVAYLNTYNFCFLPLSKAGVGGFRQLHTDAVGNDRPKEDTAVLTQTVEWYLTDTIGNRF